MSVKFQNFDYCFLKKKKFIFCPSDKGRSVGQIIKKAIENNINFPEFYYHLNEGGHVAALHAHRQNKFFCKVDLSNFLFARSQSHCFFNAASGN